MASATNIKRRGSVYYVRVAVPKEVQGALNDKKEVWKSLGVKDLKSAKRLAPEVLSELHQTFDEARQRREPDDETIRQAVWNFYQREMGLDEAERVGRGGDNSGAKYTASREADLLAHDLTASDEANISAWFRSEELRALKEHLRTNETQLVRWAADEIIRDNRFLIECDTPAYRSLCRALVKAKIDSLHRRKERDDANYDGEPSRNLVPRPAFQSDAPANTSTQPLMQLYERFVREKGETIKFDTLDQNKKIVALFADFVGLKAGPEAITRKNVAAWKDALSEWPVKASETAAFRGLSFKQVIVANRSVGKPPISNKTLNKYLTALSAFCRWLVARGEIVDNPVKDLFVSLDKNKQKIWPYTLEQLKAIFASPVFIGCLCDRKEHVSGNYLVRDHRYWLPLMSLFSGARLGELCQLLVGDIRELDGQWIMNITTDGSDEKQLKSKNAQRVVPIHTELVRLGLLEHHRKRVSVGETRLFPEIRPDMRGYLSGFPSRWYGRYMTRIGVKHDKKINFHSHRHSFIDGLRQAGYYKDQYQPLIGHAGASVTDRYGALPDGTLHKRVEMVEAVRYPGLDLSALYAGS